MLAKLILSFGVYHHNIESSQLSQADKDLLNSNNPYIFYTGQVPTNYSAFEDDGITPINTIENCVGKGLYTGGGFNEEKTSIQEFWDSAVGVTNQEKFDTFNDDEKLILVNYNMIEESIAVPFLESSQGLTNAQATSWYISISTL